MVQLKDLGSHTHRNTVHTHTHARTHGTFLFVLSQACVLAHCSHVSLEKRNNQHTHPDTYTFGHDFQLSILSSRDDVCTADHVSPSCCSGRVLVDMVLVVDVLARLSLPPAAAVRRARPAERRLLLPRLRPRHRQLHRRHVQRYVSCPTFAATGFSVCCRGAYDGTKCSATSNAER